MGMILRREESKGIKGVIKSIEGTYSKDFWASTLPIKLVLNSTHKLIEDGCITRQWSSELELEPPESQL